MAFKASIFLLFLTVHPLESRAVGGFESELREKIQKNDWSGQVLLLKPKQGQNFEHDLQLGKALLHLERRPEALSVLHSLLRGERDERILKVLRFASEMFFSQETSNLYFEGVRLISLTKYSDAKDRFEQANSREPGNGLILSRLIQVEILLGQLDSASARLKEFLVLAPPTPELKVFALRLALTADDLGKSDPSRTLLIPKRPYPEDQVPLVFTLEALKKSGKIDEIRSLADEVLKKKTSLPHVLGWLYSSGVLSDEKKKNVKNKLERELKSKEQFEKNLDKEMKQTQYYWMGYISYEDLVKNAR